MLNLLKNKYTQYTQYTNTFILICIVLSIILACTPKPINFYATDITGSNIGRNTVTWRLYNAKGQAVQLEDFKGKILVVFFGFTQCPDVCPTTLINYAYALKSLKQQAIDTANIQVVFITLDPERDKFPQLQQFTAAFNSNFIALRGDSNVTKQAADSFKIFYAKTNQSSDYSIDHTAASYIFDAQGRIRLFVRHDQSIDNLVHDLKQIMPP